MCRVLLWWMSFIHCAIYVECHLCYLSCLFSLFLVSFILSVIYSECHLCWASFILSVFMFYVVSFLLSVIYTFMHNLNNEKHDNQCNDNRLWVFFRQSVIYTESHIFIVMLIVVILSVVAPLNSFLWRAACFTASRRASL
jgi:hypothetical protein